MTDPVNAATVLRSVRDDWYMAGAEHEQVDALLACGGGDPVVIMPDWTLRRLHGPWAEGLGAQPGLVLADPVQPQEATDG